MIVMMAITFLGSACAQSIRVSNYCDLPSNYAGSKLYYDHPEVLAQVDSVDHALFIDRVNLLAKATNQEKVTPVGDHAYIVGDVAHTRMLIIMLDKRGCIVNKIPLSPGYYEFIMAIDDKLVFLQRSGVV
tara:strand:- start:175 stop:564 length:390 start_codon:yes stop_codon:yes gene_type:complete